MPVKRINRKYSTNQVSEEFGAVHNVAYRGTPHNGTPLATAS